MRVVPPFTSEGVLPAGDYALTINQLLTSPLVIGNFQQHEWSTNWRAKLVAGLSVLVGHLMQVGIRDVFVDGSFVENKMIPNDIDGYFVVDRMGWLSGEIPRQLAAIDSCWTWNHEVRETFRSYPKPQLPMWHKYRVELFPDYGQPCGISDGDGRMLTFAQAFRQSRQFLEKGIVKIGGLS